MKRQFKISFREEEIAEGISEIIGEVKIGASVTITADMLDSYTLDVNELAKRKIISDIEQFLYGDLDYDVAKLASKIYYSVDWIQRSITPETIKYEENKILDNKVEIVEDKNNEF